MLVDPRRIKNVSARPTCWTASGSATAHLRPTVGSLSSQGGHLRKATGQLVEYASHHIQHMQKALTQSHQQHHRQDRYGHRSHRGGLAVSPPRDEGRRGDDSGRRACPGTVPVLSTIRLPSATGRLKPSWSGSRTAAMAGLRPMARRGQVNAPRFDDQDPA